MSVVPVWLSVIVPMLVSFHVVAARHDEDATPGSHHVDLGAIKARQHGAGDDLIDGAERRLAAPEIEHPVERAGFHPGNAVVELDGTCAACSHPS